MKNELSAIVASRRLRVAVVVLAAPLWALSGCSKSSDTAATPATVVMPTDAASAPTATADTTSPTAGAGSTGSAGTDAGASSAATSLPRGTVSVISGDGSAAASAATGTAPAPAPAPFASATAGIPASSPGLPGPAAIGRSATGSGDQPQSVSPGTTR